jgi:hypothetical protein
VLFPYLSGVRVGDRAREFGQRYRQLGVPCVTLPLYCYARAERAKAAGCPESFAQAALGHNSKSVHRAYPKRALMKISSLEEYERKAGAKAELTKQLSKISVCSREETLRMQHGANYIILIYLN